jgi:hypothetical protein
MPITVMWDDAEQATIRIIYETPWTWDDFDGATKDVAALVTEVEHKPCLIHDAEKSTGYPSSNVLPHYRKALLELSPYVNFHIGVGTISFTKTVVAIILGVMGGSMQYVETLEEARQLAADARAADES